MSETKHCRLLILGSGPAGYAAAVYAAFIAGMFEVLAYLSLLGWIRVVVAVLAAGIAAIHLKDYVAFKQGVSLTTPDAAKPGIYRGIRRVVRADGNFPKIEALLADAQARRDAGALVGPSGESALDAYQAVLAIDGGNQSGVPYGRGWEIFDDRYLGKPLVFCGTVGSLPVTVDGRPGEQKGARPGDLIVIRNEGPAGGPGMREMLAVTAALAVMVFDVLIGVLIAANGLGLRWSQIQWLATALTFGLAFGLQEMFANFVAGLIILFERPIRVGDVVTVEDITGVVSRVRIRATTIINWDRKEFVVPNKEFITGRLLNWSLTDDMTRLMVPIGVAYGSDVMLAMKLAEEAAREHPEVLDDPAPFIIFEGFGDNSLQLGLRVYLPSLEHRLTTKSEINAAINASYEEAGIVIAYPQRDVHLDTRRPLDIRVVQENT